MRLVDLGPEEVTTAQMHDILKLRSDVFVVEQECVYADVDGRDLEAGTRHVWLQDENGIASYLRLLDNGDAHQISRVVTRLDARGTRISSQLIEHSIHTAPKRLTLESQTHLVAYYQQFGFVIAGDEYIEDGIPHTPMNLKRESK